MSFLGECTLYSKDYESFEVCTSGLKLWTSDECRLPKSWDFPGSVSMHRLVRTKGGAFIVKNGSETIGTSEAADWSLFSCASFYMPMAKWNQ